MHREHVIVGSSAILHYRRLLHPLGGGKSFGELAEEVKQASPFSSRKLRIDVQFGCGVLCGCSEDNSSKSAEMAAES